ncbi:MAG TPA: ACT domain-containing protein [Polyangiaceae bacterium]
MSSDRKYMVLSAIGPDRPGLVQEISQAIHAAAANLEDSRMAILGGEFALILLFSGSPSAIEAVRTNTGTFESRLGLRVSLKETTRTAAGEAFLPYRLRVSGVDRPGIVASVSRVLAGRSINVASLESRVTNAPLSGTPMFVLVAELQVPSAVALSRFRKDLAAACDDDNLDFSLEAV